MPDAIFREIPGIVKPGPLTSKSIPALVLLPLVKVARTLTCDAETARIQRLIATLSSALAGLDTTAVGTTVATSVAATNPAL